MKLSSKPAASSCRGTMRRTYIAHAAGIAAVLSWGCSQRNEWRDHYIDPPAAPQPKPKPKPTPRPVETDSSFSDAAVGSSSPSSVDAVSEAGVDVATSSQPGTELDASSPDDAAPDARAPIAEGAPLVNSDLADLSLDVFGTYANRYWFVVSSEQVEAMHQGRYGGRPVGLYGDIYTPDGSNGKTYVDHLLVTNPAGSTADVGKVQATLVGGSTYRPWTESSLPNIKIDSDEFQDSVRLGGYEHLRFNNAIIGSIFREKYAFDFYRALGYPAPNAGYGWVSSTVWSPDVAVPYVVVESYKRQFCRDREDYFGGECPNMWEFANDITWYGAFSEPDSCQYSQCDATLAQEMSALVAQTPRGPGFKDTTATYIDWDAFHEFQCLSWLFGTGDDYVHGGNNTVVVERPDGKFQFLPYSVDISFNHDWAWSTPLPGHTALPQGCQSDPQCWEDTIATCQVLVDAYVAADPVGRLDALYVGLDDAGMLRQGDDLRYEEMRSGISTRISELQDELVYWRDNPDGYGSYCNYPYVQCGDVCQLPQDCYLCGHEPGAGPIPVPIAPGPGLWFLSADGGAADVSAAGASAADAGAASVTPQTSAGEAAAPETSAAVGPVSASLDGDTAASMANGGYDAAAPSVDASAPRTDAAVAWNGTDTSEYGHTGGHQTDETTGGHTCQPYINYYYVH